MKGIPKNEIIWVTYIDSDRVYYITSKPARDCYYVYKTNNGVAVKLGQSKSPLTLEEKYINNSE